MRVNKICFVMPWHINERGGGAEVQAHILAEDLAKRGFKVAYICQTNNLLKVGRLEIINNVECYYVKSSGLFAWIDQNKYYEILKKVSPDIVIQRMSSNVSYVISKYTRNFSARFIWICTDNLSCSKSLCRQKIILRSSANRHNLLKKIIIWINASILDLYRNEGMRHVDFAFHQSTYQEQLISKNFRLTSRKIISGHVVPNHDSEKELDLLKSDILWCGNLGRNKRPEVFIDLARKLNDVGLNFVMMGDHPDRKYKDSLLKNLPTSINYIGQKEYKNSLSEFDDKFLLINTSTSEGFSNTFVQAWMRGVPVITFGVDPDNTIVANGLGWKVKSVDEACHVIRSLLVNPAIYKDYSIRVRNYATSNHSVGVMVDKFLFDIGLCE